MQFLLNVVCAIHTASIYCRYDTLFYFSLWYVLSHPKSCYRVRVRVSILVILTSLHVVV